MPLANYIPQYVDNTLLQIQIEMKETKTTHSNGNNNDGLAKASCKRKSKQQQLYGLDINFIKEQKHHKQDKYEDERECVEKELNICIKPRNCNKQIHTTNSTATNEVARNLNCKCLLFPNNNSNSRSINNNNYDYNQTKYCNSSNNINSYNSKSHNSIISILLGKQFKATQQQQQQLPQEHHHHHHQQQRYNKHHHYLIPKTTCPIHSQHFASPTPLTQKYFLSHYHKMTNKLQDLFYILYYILLLVFIPLHLIQLAEASCRYEPSRSCEAICRPIWSPPDNNNYQSTELATNNVTLENFFAADYNCTIRALVLMPDDERYVASLKRVVPILQVAEQHIHASGLLPSYIQFDWMPQDDKCDAAFAAVKAMDGIVKNCSHVFFGPVCDYSLAAVGRIAKYFNSNGTPLISVGGSTFDFEKPKTKCSDEFYMLLRTGMLSFESISELTIAVMKRNKWSRSIFFYDADGQRNVAGQHTCYLMMTSLGKQMRNENMTFAQYRITEKLKNRTEEMTREIGNKHSGE